MRRRIFLYLCLRIFARFALRPFIERRFSFSPSFAWRPPHCAYVTLAGGSRPNKAGHCTTIELRRQQRRAARGRAFSDWPGGGRTPDQFYNQRMAALTYLDVQTLTADCFMGGLLTVNELGLPTEFLYSEPIRPSKLQASLYGTTLGLVIYC